MPNGDEKTKYAEGLLAYLNAAVARGWMSAEEAQSIYQTASIQAGRGDPISGLPYYEGAMYQAGAPAREMEALARREQAATPSPTPGWQYTRPGETLRQQIARLEAEASRIGGAEVPGTDYAIASPIWRELSGLRRKLELQEAQQMVEDYPEWFETFQKVIREPWPALGRERPGGGRDIIPPEIMGPTGVPVVQKTYWPKYMQELEEPQLMGQTPFVRWLGEQPEFEQFRLERERFREFGPPLRPEGVTGPHPWRDWYDKRYGEIRREFMTRPLEERKPATWAEILRGRKPELKEEWLGLGWRRRGERPGVFAPKIRTVKF